MRTPTSVLLNLLNKTTQLNAYRSVLVQVVALARQAPGLSEEQVRTRLGALGAEAVRELDGEAR